MDVHLIHQANDTPYRKARVLSLAVRESEVVWIESVSADWPEVFEGAANFVPEIVAGEYDMRPGKRCGLGEQLGGDIDALGAHIIDSAAEIDGVPQDNGVDDEVET